MRNDPERVQEQVQLAEEGDPLGIVQVTKFNHAQIRKIVQENKTNKILWILRSKWITQS